MADPLEHLLGEQEHGFDCESPVAVVVEIFDARAEHFQDHRLVVLIDRAAPSYARATVASARLHSALALPVHLRHAGAFDRAIDLTFSRELRMPRARRLELDGHSLVREQVAPFVDAPERARTDRCADLPALVNGRRYGRVLPTCVVAAVVIGLHSHVSALARNSCLRSYQQRNKLRLLVERRAD